MKIGRKDWIFIGVIVAVLATFFAISGKEKTKHVPYDDTHKPYYEIMAKTHDKKEAEKDCMKCHNDTGVPFPKDHPPKNRCLFCHKMVKPKQ